VLKLFGRLLLWDPLPNKRNAHFFNPWAGKRDLTRFRNGIAEELGKVFDLAAQGGPAERTDTADQAAQLREVPGPGTLSFGGSR
jgi:hypothetical protein